MSERTSFTVFVQGPGRSAPIARRAARALGRCVSRLAWPLLLASGVLSTGAALAQQASPDENPLVVVIEKGTEGAVPIAVVPFGWAGNTRAPLDMADVIGADLRRSGRFAPIAERDLPGRPTTQQEVSLPAWRAIGANNLVIGRMTPASNGSVSVEFQLLDANGGRLSGQRWDVPASQLRWLAHHISDLIYEKLLGERGAFNTRIAYITERRTPETRIYTLLVADSDGFNPQVVLQRRTPIMSPTWSPDGRYLAYVSFEGGRSGVYVQELSSGARSRVSAFTGHNGAPAFSPDGSRLALSLSKDGNAEIYTLELSSKRLRRLTDNSAIDTEPTWSADGRYIAFNSDRGGRPQIYRIPANGGEVERLTFEGAYNARPQYSPDGRHLAFVRGDDGVFRIGVMDLGSGQSRILTDSFLDESPTFAPNGSMILYATSNRRSSALAAVSVDGNVQQTLVEQRVATREPAWSPFLGRK
ncbi:MAG: Tol-Pal system beta propeller repeat protein TolB [Gammaproteobacteria bacterium]|nr:Tol-Pal system beta propeller repeat protein TolB [Gammaproteobacteria bacterium]